MTRTFFDLSLQAFLERRFQIRAEIVEKPPETAVPAIANVHGYSYGGIYGDAGDTFLVQLYNGPFALRLEFAVHHESAQIDSWNVLAEGVPQDAVEELRALCDPRQYDLYWCNNHLEPRIEIKGI
jgi:hypothetical protein